MQAALAARGIRVVDLRPPLRLARSGGNTYRKLDSHWTFRGALIAFNTIATAAGHTDWLFDPATALGPLVSVPGGDLAEMLGVASYLTEEIEYLTLPPGRNELYGPQPFATFQSFLGQATGAKIMVIGDSFTTAFFPPMVLARTGRFLWTHHSHCEFDWKWIERFQPDEVWYMPTERYLPCAAGPKGIPNQ
jgi:hypothetical protein